MIELLNLIATLCAIHSGGSAGSADWTQTACQAELVWCVMDKSLTSGEYPAALSGCIVKRAAKHDWWKPEEKK